MSCERTRAVSFSLLASTAFILWVCVQVPGEARLGFEKGSWKVALKAVMTPPDMGYGYQILSFSVARSALNS